MHIHLKQKYVTVPSLKKKLISYHYERRLLATWHMQYCVFRVNINM
jgi:hypothetical protein